MSTLDQGSNPRKNSSSIMGRTLLSMNIADGKGGNLLLVVTLQIIPWNKTSIKVENDKE